MTQPECNEKAKVDEKGNFIGHRKINTVPYTGRKNQNRISFSDTLGDISMIRMTGDNPSFDRALILANCYENLNGRKRKYSSAERIHDLVKLGGYRK